MSRAEKCLLGGILVGGRIAFDDAAKIVQTKHFRTPEHAVIWQALESLASQNVAIDSVTLTNEMENRGTLDRIGGVRYLGSLLDDVNSLLVDPDAVKDHAAAVRDGWVRRQLGGDT